VQVRPARHHKTGKGPVPGGVNTPNFITVPVAALSCE
jgi:hypothetical protein